MISWNLFDATQLPTELQAKQLTGIHWLNSLTWLNWVLIDFLSPLNQRPRVVPMPIALNEAVRLLVVNRGRRDDAPLASRCQNKRKKVKILGFILGCSTSHQLMKLDVCQSRWVSLYPIPIAFLKEDHPQREVYPEGLHTHAGAKGLSSWGSHNGRSLQVAWSVLDHAGLQIWSRAG